MGQYARRITLGALLLMVTVLALIGVPGCERKPTSSPGTADSKTIASLVPAVTDMLLQMQLRERLVGVSHFDPPEQGLTGIEPVGDYHSVDWEKLSQIRPAVLFIPRPRQELEKPFADRAEEMGIKLVPTHIDRLDEIYAAVEQVAEAVGEPERGRKLNEQIRGQLTRIAEKAASRPKLRTLIVLDESAQFIVGHKNFLDDVLTIVGGENVAAGLEKDYPKIDREKLLEINPDVVIQFLPGAPKQVVQSAESFWKTVPELSAARNGRVYTHSEWYLLLPSPRVVDVAKIMAADLHGLTEPASATTVPADAK